MSFKKETSLGRPRGSEISSQGPACSLPMPVFPPTGAASHRLSDDACPADNGPDLPDETGTTWAWIGAIIFTGQGSHLLVPQLSLFRDVNSHRASPKTNP